MFSSRILLNLGLVIFLGILISLVLFDNIERTPVSDFSTLNKSDINSINISHKKKTTTIDKTGSTWYITKPVPTEADEFRIHAILAILSDNSAESYEITEQDYKKFSLDPAQATLTLNQQVFKFGSTSSVNNYRYILTNKKLFLFEDTLYPLITSGFKNLMRRYLFASGTQIRKFKINEKHIYINESSSWESNDNKLSSDALKRFIDNWIYIQAYAVTSAKPPFLGKEVKVITSDNKEVSLLINKTDVNTVVINPKLGVSYQFDSSAFKSLTTPSHFSSDTQ